MKRIQRLAIAALGLSELAIARPTSANTSLPQTEYIEYDHVCIGVPGPGSGSAPPAAPTILMFFIDSPLSGCAGVFDKHRAPFGPSLVVCVETASPDARGRAEAEEHDSAWAE